MSASLFNRPVHPAAPPSGAETSRPLSRRIRSASPFHRHPTAAAITLPAFNPHSPAHTVQSNYIFATARGTLAFPLMLNFGREQSQRFLFVRRCLTDL